MPAARPASSEGCFAKNDDPCTPGTYYSTQDGSIFGLAEQMSFQRATRHSSALPGSTYGRLPTTLARSREGTSLVSNITSNNHKVRVETRTLSYLSFTHDAPEHQLF